MNIVPLPSSESGRMSAPVARATAGLRHDDSRTSSDVLVGVALTVLFATLCAVTVVVAISNQAPFSEFWSLARRCVEQNDCPSRGGPTGMFRMTHHGAIWIRLLAYAQRTGHDNTFVQAIVRGWLLLSIPITLYWLKRQFRWLVAGLAIGLYFPIVVASCDITQLTYTNLLPTCFAIYYASIFLWLEHRRLVFAVVGSVALAAAISAELGTIVMVPFHVVLVMHLARRPVFDSLVSALAIAIPFALESTDAALDLLRQLPTIRFAIGVVITLAVIAIGRQVTRRLRPSASRSPAELGRAVAIAALLYLVSTVWLAHLLVTHHLPEARYFQPAVFPFLYLVAERMSSLTTKGLVAAAAIECLSLVLLVGAPQAADPLQVFVLFTVTGCALVTGMQLARGGAAALPVQRPWWSLLVCIPAIGLAAGYMVLQAGRAPTQGLTMSEAEGLISQLYGARYGYAQLLSTLRGPAADDLISLLAEQDPDMFTAPAHEDLHEEDFTLLALKVPDAAVGRTAAVVAVAPADLGRSAIVVRADRSFLDWVHVRLCDPTGDCLEPRSQRAISHHWPFVEFGPQPAEGASPWESKTRAVGSRFEVPVRLTGRGVPHTIRATNQWPARWRITAVRGVDFEGTVPGVEIRLADTEASTGVVEFAFDPFSPPWLWIPPVLEVSDGNEHLLESFGRPE